MPIAINAINPSIASAYVTLMLVTGSVILSVSSTKFAIGSRYSSRLFISSIPFVFRVVIFVLTYLPSFLFPLGGGFLKKLE